MKDRERIIIRALLEILKRPGTQQCDEAVLHSAVGVLVPQLLISELNDATRFAERERWITGIKGPFGNNKWSISDLGKAALTEM
jgi:hypothetical protein